MKKLMMTVIAGSLCTAFGSVYAQGTPGPSGSQSTPTSQTGVTTPKQTDDNRMSVGKGGAKGSMSTGASTTGAGSAASTTTGASTTGASTTGASTSTSTDMGTERKGRRAARREKG